MEVVFTVYVIATILRVAIFKYLPVDTMSDHLFLALSVSAMLQMDACLAFESWAPSKQQVAAAEAMWLSLSLKTFSRGLKAYAKAYALLAMVALDGMVVLLMMHMAYYTVAYYHNIDDSVIALLGGACIFHGFVAWALYGEHVWARSHGVTRGMASVIAEEVLAKSSRGI